ncbi:FAD-dependent oxidoreductase [Pelagibacteraceae bacterium]|nr:FAD-dependent oxidoreductase [Pelagibacteraceae bacterium]
MKNIAIIGAGMTGLSLAYNLQDKNVTIFDKSWRAGGRVSTRMHDNLIFDHGAHYLSNRHNVKQLSEILKRLDLIKEKEIIFSTNFKKNEIIKKKIFIGKNGMNFIPKKIFENIKIKSYFNSKILKISKNKKNNYNLYTEDQEFVDYDLVLLCIPYLQAKELTTNYISFNNNHIPEYDPIYTLMFSYKDSTNINIDCGINLHDDISFFMKQNFKFPSLKYESWVINMSTNYTKRNLDIKNVDLENYSLSIFNDIFKITTNPFFIKTHRWLYAQTNKTYNSLSRKKWINSKDNKIFLTGDWVLGKSLSDAWNSGLQLSHYLKILDI